MSLRFSVLLLVFAAILFSGCNGAVYSTPVCDATNKISLRNFAGRYNADLGKEKVEVELKAKARGEYEVIWRNGTTELRDELATCRIGNAYYAEGRSDQDIFGYKMMRGLSLVNPSQRSVTFSRLYFNEGKLRSQGIPFKDESKLLDKRLVVDNAGLLAIEVVRAMDFDPLMFVLKRVSRWW